jgi:DNA-binding LacI/PurR family transcriptional regulator
MTGERVTIDDVAAAAGVSRQTVSNVLRGTGRVGPDTADRIRSIVDRLGYAPHPGASSLRSRRSGQLAYPMGESALAPDNVTVMEFTTALARSAGTHGYHVLLTSTGPKDMRDLVRSGRVDGFVFSDMVGGYDERLEIVAETGIPFAAFGRVPTTLRQAWVDVDNATGTRRATDHMAALGHRAIAYLGYTPGAYWDTERIDGYRASIAEHGLEARVVTHDNDRSAITDAAARLLRREDRPTAIVCASDSIAVSVYEAADRVGLVVGKDLAVAGFDSSIIGRSLVPTLTTMRVPVDRIAELVVERFVLELARPAEDPGGVFVVPDLQPGASSASP